MKKIKLIIDENIVRNEKIKVTKTVKVKAVSEIHKN